MTRRLVCFYTRLEQWSQDEFAEARCGGSGYMMHSRCTKWVIQGSKSLVAKLEDDKLYQAARRVSGKPAVLPCQGVGPLPTGQTGGERPLVHSASIS